MNIDDRTKIPYAVRDGLRQMIVTVVFSLLSLQSQSIVIFFSCLWHTNTHWLHFQHFSFLGIYDTLLYAVFTVYFSA